jgi:hypothetical protein
LFDLPSIAILPEEAALNDKNLDGPASRYEKQYNLTYLYEYSVCTSVKKSLSLKKMIQPWHSRAQKELYRAALSLFTSAICTRKVQKSKKGFFRRPRGKPGAIYWHFLHELFFALHPLRTFVERAHV